MPSCAGAIASSVKTKPSAAAAGQTIPPATCGQGTGSLKGLTGGAPASKTQHLDQEHPESSPLGTRAGRPGIKLSVGWGGERKGWG